MTTILGPVLRAGAVAATLAIGGCAGYTGYGSNYSWGYGPDYYNYDNDLPGYYGDYGGGLLLGGGYGGYGWWGHDHDRWHGWNGWAGGWHGNHLAGGWHGGFGTHPAFGTMHASAAPIGHIGGGFFGGHGFGGEHH